MVIYELELDDTRYRVSAEHDCYAVLRVDDNQRVGRFMVRRERNGTLSHWLDACDVVLDRIARELIDHGWVSPPDR